MHVLDIDVKDRGTEPYFPLGDYSVFLETKGAATSGVMLSVSQAGNVVNMWTGCGGTVADMYQARMGGQVLLAPLQKGG